MHIIQYIDVANVKSFLLGIQGVHIQRKGCQRFLHYAMDDANTGCVLLRFKIYDSRSTIIHEFSFFLFEFHKDICGVGSANRNLITQHVYICNRWTAIFDT